MTSCGCPLVDEARNCVESMVWQPCLLRPWRSFVSLFLEEVENNLRPYITIQVVIAAQPGSGKNGSEQVAYVTISFDPIDTALDNVIVAANPVAVVTCDTLPQPTATPCVVTTASSVADVQAMPPNPKAVYTGVQFVMTAVSAVDSTWIPELQLSKPARIVIQYLNKANFENDSKGMHLFFLDLTKIVANDLVSVSQAWTETCVARRKSQTQSMIPPLGV